MRDKEGLSYGVGSGFGVPTKDDGAMFSTNAICNPQNLPKAEASIKDELARTVKDGFTAEEVAAAKKSWLEERMVARSQDQGVMGTLGTREFWSRTMKWDEALEAKVSALTPQQVSEAFRKHIDPSALTVVKAGRFQEGWSAAVTGTAAGTGRLPPMTVRARTSARMSAAILIAAAAFSEAVRP